jgi:hypothetical protein
MYTHLTRSIRVQIRYRGMTQEQKHSSKEFVISEEYADRTLFEFTIKACLEVLPIKLKMGCSMHMDQSYRPIMALCVQIFNH